MQNVKTYMYYERLFWEKIIALSTLLLTDITQCKVY